MAVNRLTIPDWTPTSLNRLLVHWATRRKMKRSDASIIAGHALQQRIAVATGKRRVSLEITLAGRAKALDEDNAHKGLRDALVAARLLIDDNQDWCESGTVTYTRGPKKQTVIVLEDR